MKFKIVLCTETLAADIFCSRACVQSAAHQFVSIDFGKFRTIFHSFFLFCICVFAYGTLAAAGIVMSVVGVGCQFILLEMKTAIKQYAFVNTTRKADAK